MDIASRLEIIGRAFDTVERHREVIERELRGKKAEYYGGVFRIAQTRVEFWSNGAGGVYASGPILKKNGEPHAKNTGSMRVDKLVFVD